MASPWDNVKKNTRLVGRDLDAEFEQFMDESLSDDPSHPNAELSVSPRKSKSFNPKRRPWWDDKDDNAGDHTGMSDIVKRLMKSKSAIDGTLSRDQGMEAGSSLMASISRDSLEASGNALKLGPDLEALRRYNAEDSVDVDEVTAASKDSSQESQPTSVSPEVTESSRQKEIPPKDLPGGDTLDEIQEKRKFFQDLYGEGNTTLDFAKLNQQLDVDSASRRDDSSTQERSSTENVTMKSSPILVRQDTAGTEADAAHVLYSNDEFEDEEPSSHSDQREMSKKESEEEDKTEESISNTISPDHGPMESTNDDVNEIAKDLTTSLLSKVALMESFDSTGGRQELALKKRNKLKLQQGHLMTTEEGIEDNHEESEQPSLSSANDHQSLQGTSTAEMKDLQLALAQIRDLPLDGTKEMSAMQTGNAAVEEGISLSKSDRGLAEARGFGAKPPPVSSLHIDVQLPQLLDVEETTEDESSSKIEPLPAERHNVESEVNQAQMTDENETERGSEAPTSPVMFGESRGFDLHPITSYSDGNESPPTDSLRSIKEIAEKRRQQAVQSRIEETQKQLLAKSKTPSGIPRPKSAAKIKSTQQGTPKKQFHRRTSTPNSKSPHGKRVSRSDESILTVSRSKGQPKKAAPEVRSKQKRKVPAKAKSHASMVNLRTYTKTDLAAEVGKSWQPEHNIDELSPLKSSKAKESGLADVAAGLERERQLLSKFQELQLAFHEEQQAKVVLGKQLESTNSTWQNRLETQRIKFASTCKDLEQQIFVLQSKLSPVKEPKTADNISGEHQLLLKNLDEQEVLLRGYQQENERLCKSMKQMQQDHKTTEGKMFAENQKLASDTSRLKEKLESLETQRRRSSPSHDITNAAFASHKTSQLENQVKYYQDKEAELQNEIGFLQGENEVLHRRIKLLEKDRIGILEADVEKKLSEQETRHGREMSQLRKKVSWYAENQELLDKNQEVLSDKSKEIERLKGELEQIHKQNGDGQDAKAALMKVRDSDGKRIKDLERQIKEMDEIIRRRYPNSLPALIYAVTEKGDDVQTTKSSSTVSNPSRNLLERKITKLEEQLKEKDDECILKLRTMEQKYNSMSEQYRDHVNHLESQLAKPTKSPSEREQIKKLEKDLRQEKETNSELRQELVDLQREPVVISGTGKNSKRQSRAVDSSNTQTTEIAELRKAVKVLQKERETMLANNFEQQQQSQSKVNQIPQFLIDQLESLSVQRNELRDLLEEARCKVIDLEHQLKTEQTTSEQVISNATDDLRQQLLLLRSQHIEELERLKVDFALGHSSSKVAELNGKLESQNKVVEHLKRRLAEAKSEEDSLSAARSREKSLRHEISQLRDNLADAESHHSPEMQQFRNLQSKITQMEDRHLKRERELQEVIDSSKVSAAVDFKAREDTWKNALRTKTNEVEQFREQLEGILDVLSELHRQGVILPQSGNLPL